MVAIDEHVNGISFIQQLTEVEALLQRADTRVTFWGTRVVVVRGFTSSVSLDKLARKVLAASDFASDRNLWSTDQNRHSEYNVLRTLKNFYETTDTQIQDSNILTRILNYVREFAIPFYNTPRFHIGTKFHNRETFFQALRLIQDRRAV